MINNPPGPHSIVLPFHKAPRLSLKENALSNALYAAFPEQAFGGETTLSIQSSMSDAALSEETRNIERYVISTMQHPRSPASLTSSVVQKPLEERLFDATASVKILTAQVSMHLEHEWRDKLFRQLDSLHDPEEWEPDDEPIQQASFATFLKAIVQLKPQRRPGLGLSHGGNLIAAWSTGRDRLTIEFLPNDGVRWVISRFRDDESERFAGQTAVSRLAEGLAHYSPDNWLCA